MQSALGWERNMQFTTFQQWHLSHWCGWWALDQKEVKTDRVKLFVLLFRSGDSLMPTEAELNRVLSHIQELLYTASDVSHDRCVKVLTARARVGGASPTAGQTLGSLGSILDFSCFRQDGSLERLSSAEFVCLSQTIEGFVRDTEDLCGRRSVSLRGALQSQANRFVHRFHEERKTKLRYPLALIGSWNMFILLINIQSQNIWMNFSVVLLQPPSR